MQESAIDAQILVIIPTRKLKATLINSFKITTSIKLWCDAYLTGQPFEEFEDLDDRSLGKLQFAMLDIWKKKEDKGTYQVVVYKLQVVEAEIKVLTRQLEETNYVLENVERQVAEAEMAVEGNRRQLESW